jgi:hypothetical protein
MGEILESIFNKSFYVEPIWVDSYCSDKMTLTFTWQVI